MNVSDEDIGIFQTTDAPWHLLMISAYCGVHSESFVWIWPSIEFTWPATVTYILQTSCTHVVIHSRIVIYAPDEHR